MKFNCCTVTDYAVLEEYNNHLHLSAEMNHFYSKYYITEIFKHHEEYVEISKVILSNEVDQICSQAAQSIISATVDKSVIHRVSELLEEMNEFDINFKQGFRCILCDFDSIDYFKKELGILEFNVDVCEKIVNRTFDYYMFFHNFVWRYINGVNFLAHCASNPNQLGRFKIENEERFEFIEIDNSFYTLACKRARKIVDDDIMVNCLNYCQKYNFFNYQAPLYVDNSKMNKIFRNIESNLFETKGNELKDPDDRITSYILPFKEIDLNVLYLYKKIFTENGMKASKFITISNK